MSLRDIIAQEIDTPVSDVARACADHLRQHFGSRTAGIFLYGAALRDTPTPETLFDFYVVVDDLRAALGSNLSAFAAWALPPNVYFITAPIAGETLRMKVAVMSRRGFQKAMHGFASDIWARFSQPVALIYARNVEARTALVDALCDAVTTMIAATSPVLPMRFSAAFLWQRAFTETYAAEMRPEYSDRARTIVTAAAARYEAVTVAVLGAADADGLYSPLFQDRAVRRWALRRHWGKALNVLRLMKAAFTFAGGLDYAVDKIARHTGVCVAVSDADRKKPLRAGIRIFLEARRRGGLR